MEVAMTTAVAAPTTAERIRSACVRAGGAMLAIEGVDPIATPVHHLLDDGSFAITVPGNGTLAGMVVAAGSAGVQAVLEMTDYPCASRCAHWFGSADAYTASPTAKSPHCST
jgi:hypothetical protein